MRTDAATLLILAGGRSTRMGRSKADLPVDGETLLERLVRRLAPAFLDTIVCGAVAPPGARSVPDRRPGVGPLGGIEAGLAATHTAYAFVVACDIPDATPRLASLLLDRAHGRDAAVPLVGGQPQPVCAVYRTGVAAAIGSYLDAGGRRLTELVARLDAAYLDEEALRGAGIAPHELGDLDEPGDYEAFIRRRGGSV